MYEEKCGWKGNKNEDSQHATDKTDSQTPPQIGPGLSELLKVENQQYFVE
jgi:hypothetical protein